MANVQHVDLTDPYVHEPKDITSALSGQVYVADGSNSGDWDYQRPSNVVIVESASSLPGQGTGTITLAANTVYQIVGVIDIGADGIVMSANSVLRGNNTFADGLTTSTSGVAVTVTDVTNARLENMNISCASGTAFDVDGTGVENFAIIRCQFTCDTIGDFDNMNLVNIERSIITAASAGATFTGAHSNVFLFFPIWSVTATNGTVIDLGTATFNRLFIQNAVIGNPTGTGYGLDAAASGANINANGLGLIANADFAQLSNATNFTSGDPRWHKSNVPAVPSLNAGAQGSVDGNANANTFGGGVGVAEAVSFGTSFVADVARRFTVSTAGRFTYTGETDTTVTVNASARVTMSGGAARVRNLYIAKNGSEISSSISSKSLDGTNEGTYAVNSIVEVSTNDYIELYIEPETATTSTTVDTASITITESGH